ncbi:MAG: 4'-phosphopantetheinyl transferase superfamily protein [Myxococcota bacterium]
MLGNDVIDLQDIDARPETFRPRFDERVFSAEERRVIARDDAPLACRWAHWGAKESAYKLARQLNPRFVFSPIQLTPRFEPAESPSESTLAESSASNAHAPVSWTERRGRIGLPPEVGSLSKGVTHSMASSRVREIEVRSYETEEWVHVIAMPLGSDWGALVSSIEERSGEDPSRAVRELAIREIGRNLGVDSERLSIGRRGKIPKVDLDGGRTSLSLSFSHHGRFVAFAMTPQVDAGNEMIWTGQVIDTARPTATSE